MQTTTDSPKTMPDPSVGSGDLFGTYELQVKYGGQWKTVRRNSDGEYLQLVGDRHWSRYAKRRILKVA